MAHPRSVAPYVPYLACLLALGACGGGASSATSPTPSTTALAAPPPPRPNVVIVVADDLDLATTRQLPRLPDLLANRGLSFTRAYVTQSLCSPSRASLLTGQYTHNHGVHDNSGNGQGFPAFRASEGQTIAVWLKAAGYRTALVGKYLNEFPLKGGEGYIPPGWDDWYAHLTALEDGRYWNYWVSDNGNVSRIGNTADEYSVDVESRRAVSFIRASAGRPEPLFLLLTPQAPHIPSNYAGRFGSEFRGSVCPRVPSFNELDVGDKPAWIRKLPVMSGADMERLDERQRWRLRSMRAVEDEIEAVMTALDDTGRLANTYVFFTSDNGLLIGQHRGMLSKAGAYEEGINVPLYVRGPGVPAGTVDQPVLNIDLAPTLLELAGAPIPESVDGRSLAPFLRGSAPGSWRSDVLIENWDLGPTYALRTTDWMYIHNDTEELELYDMKNDPWQLESLHRKVDASVLKPFEDRIRTLVACRGASCRN